MNRAQIKLKSKVQLGNSIFSNAWLTSVVIVLVAGAILGISNIVSLVFVGFVSLGVNMYFKTLVREGKASVESVFGIFKTDLGSTLILGIMQSIFIALWSLLFVIPGIVKYYAYSMAFYLKSEHPDWDWRRCLDESQRLTQGHKTDLFILDLSFIGWYIVGSLAFGIGTLWAQAYHQTARMNYFEEITAVRVD